MITNPAHEPSLQAMTRQVALLAEQRQPFTISGGGSKAFLGREMPADLPVVSTREHAGILEYEPKELILRARAGTPVSFIRETLAEQGQMLGFEPPEFEGDATLGGAIASGLAGGRRPWCGAPRDFVLGVGLVTSEGKYLEFGGQVMKNVAGFDVSRLMAGSFGTLALIADVSLKVLPLAEKEISVSAAMNRADAHALMLSLSNQSLPLSGACHNGQMAWLRFSGSRAAVDSALAVASGVAGMNFEVCDEGPTDQSPWRSLAHLKVPGATEDRTVWRVSVAAASHVMSQEADVLDWAGAQRFLVDPSFDPRERLANESGHATLVRQGATETSAKCFATLTKPVADIHKRLKQTFDPAGLMNPGRMYAEL